MEFLSIQNLVYRPWLKPMSRSVLAIILGIYGQLLIALVVWVLLGKPVQLSFQAELAVKIALVLLESSVLVLIFMDKEPLSHYINLQQPTRILLSGLVAGIPLVLANRLMQGWSIRYVHGELAYYSQLTGSTLGGLGFLLLQTVYYFMEVFVLVYAYAKLAEGLRVWKQLPEKMIVIIGGLFLFITWSLPHGFVLTSLLSFSIGIYLPFAFAALYEYTDSQVAPLIAWIMFLAL
jgi:hypothetical protein